MLSTHYFPSTRCNSILQKVYADYAFTTRISLTDIAFIEAFLCEDFCYFDLPYAVVSAFTDSSKFVLCSAEMSTMVCSACGSATANKEKSAWSRHYFFGCHFNWHKIVVVAVAARAACHKTYKDLQHSRLLADCLTTDWWLLTLQLNTLLRWLLPTGCGLGSKALQYNLKFT